MSRTTKDVPERIAHHMEDPARRKGYGYDYWSRRPYSTCWGYGPEIKRLTHRKERRIADRMMRRELDPATAGGGEG